MELRLRQYVEGLFSSAEQTQQTQELREEIICNTIQRYHDLLAEGKSEEEAYRSAVDSVGDVSELFESEKPFEAPASVVTAEQAAQIANRGRFFKAIAVGLYILCITPPILLSPLGMSDLGAALMFFFISTATGLLVYHKATKYLPLEQNPETAADAKTSAVMLAVAVGLYISCVTPNILLDDTVLNGVSPLFMFLMIAAATFLVITRKRTKANAAWKQSAAPLVEQQTQTLEKSAPYKGLYRGLTALIWVAASVLYIVLTALTFYVHVTWLLFPLAFALQKLLRAALDLKEVRA